MGYSVSGRISGQISGCQIIGILPDIKFSIRPIHWARYPAGYWAIWYPDGFRARYPARLPENSYPASYQIHHPEKHKCRISGVQISGSSLTSIRPTACNRAALRCSQFVLHSYLFHSLSAKRREQKIGIPPHNGWVKFTGYVVYIRGSSLRDIKHKERSNTLFNFIIVRLRLQGIGTAKLLNKTLHSDINCILIAFVDGSAS